MKFDKYFRDIGAGQFIITTFCLSMALLAVIVWLSNK